MSPLRTVPTANFPFACPNHLEVVGGSKGINLIAVPLFLTTGLLLALSLTAQADTITVTNTDDSGEGSLRQALLRANVRNQSIIANLHRHFRERLAISSDSTLQHEPNVRGSYVMLKID